LKNVAARIPLQAEAHWDVVAVIIRDCITERYRYVSDQGHHPGHLEPRCTAEAKDGVFTRKRHQVAVGYAGDQLKAQAAMRWANFGKL